MVSMIALRDMLALQGRMDARQLSQALHTPQPMIDAMLLRMEALGKARRITDATQDCLVGSCKRCTEGKACRQELWTLNAD